MLRSGTRKGADIPKTIRDAIRLAETLGERYIWIDALCIVQDDAISKHAELADMASIYAGAELTIIAANGENVNGGLRGIYGVLDTRHASQKVFFLGSGTEVLQRRKWAEPPEKIAWKQRCWRFREGLFPRRKLVFCDDRVSWEFGAAVWHGDSCDLDE